MAFDGITTNIVIQELKKFLINSRVEKIYVPNKNDIILSIHTGDRKNIKLLVSIDANNSRFHLTKVSKDNPAVAPQFCMILRKYIQGGKIIDITQEGLDRIINITIESINDFGDFTKKTLIIELMGKYSNVILTDDNGKIIDSMRHVTKLMSSVREVLPGKDYLTPSSLGKYQFNDLSFEEFNVLLDDNEMLSTALSNTLIGISKSFSSALLAYLGISSDKTKNDLSNDELLKVYTFINNFLKEIPNKNANFKVSESGKDYYPNFENESNNLASEFLDEFYENKEKILALRTAKSNLEHEIFAPLNKIKKKLALANEILKDTDKLEQYKQYGDLISSNIYKMKIGMEKLITENFYNNYEMVEIPLSSNLSPSRNAQSYFKKYNKLKNSIAHAKIHKAECGKDINYLESVLFNLEEATTLAEIYDIREELAQSEVIRKPGKRFKRRDSPSEPIKYEKDGIEILVGRNNTQNDRLTFKIAKKTDTWLHTKNVHGSHVIIRAENVPDNVLEYAARLAVLHSKAKGSSKVEVDYTKVKFVHKEIGSKPGMVVYTDYSSIVI